MVVATSGVVGGESFRLAILPSHPAQMPVLAKKMAVQGEEGRPCQDGPQVIPIPKGQRGQVRIIAHLHLCGAPRDSHLGRGFFNPAAAALGGPPACWTTSCKEVDQ